MSGAPLKVAFATLGCKVNQYDTATIETMLLREACEGLCATPLQREGDHGESATAPV